MSGGRLGRFVLGAAAVAGAVAIVRALRGPEAPQFATHPSVTGGPISEPASASAPTPSAATPSAPAIEPAVEGAAPELPLAELAAPPHLEELSAPEPPAGQLDAPDPPAGELAAPPHLEELSAPEPPAGVLAAPAAPTGALEGGAAPTWVEPVDGGCPEGFPVKAKLKSGIYHLPGGLAYDRTRPDRCYPDAAAAEADGLRAAKR